MGFRVIPIRWEVFEQMRVRDSGGRTNNHSVFFCPTETVLTSASLTCTRHNEIGFFCRFVLTSVTHSCSRRGGIRKMKNLVIRGEIASPLRSPEGGVGVIIISDEMDLVNSQTFSVGIINTCISHFKFIGYSFMFPISFHRR
jgi:hypothetical protein